MIPGSILSHPIDDREDDFDPDWHDLGGEAGSAYLDEDDDLKPETITNDNDFPGNDDEDHEDSFDWSATDPEAPAFDPNGDWDEDDFNIEPVRDDLDPNILRNPNETRTVRTGDRGRPRFAD